MKVYVRVGRGAKELYNDLEALSPRERAERLRVLASIGLSVVQGGVNGIAHDPAGSTQATVHGDSEQNGSRDSNLANKLMGSLK